MNVALLQEGARGFGLELDAATVAQFEQFMAELRRWNRSINLTAITQPAEIVCKHFVDSLSLVSLLKDGERLLDIGSGAGLPGLAVAMVRHDLALTSVDAVEKKMRFQRHICRLLGLKQVEVLHGRVEQLAAQRGGQYDLVISRAFRNVSRFVQLAYPFVRCGGRLVAMVAGDADDATHEAGVVCGQCDLHHLETIHYRLPHGAGERNLVVFMRNQL